MRFLGALLLTACASAGSRDGDGMLPMRTGDQLLLAAVEKPRADSALAPPLYFATQSALQQSSHVRFVSPAAITDALRRMQRPSASAMLPDSTAAEVAEREGARYVVILTVATSGASRSLTLRVLAPASRLVLRSYQASVSADAVLTGIDAVAAQLRRDLGDTPGELAATIPLPRVTTPSLEALRLFTNGGAAYRRARYSEARTLYESALALDSGFAIVWTNLANVAYVLNDVRQGDALMARALALSDRLPPRERLLIEASAARGANDWERAATLHRAYLIRYPEDYDVYTSLGYDLMRARQPLEARAAFDSLRAHRALRALDLINLALIDVRLGEYRRARESHVAALALDPEYLTRSVQNEEFGRVLLALGFADSARTVHGAMMSREPSDQARGHRLLAYVDLYDGRYTSGIAHLRQAIDLNRGVSVNALSEVRDRALLANVLIDLGQVDAAREELAAAVALALSGALPPQALLWTGKPLARLGDTASARHLLDSASARTRPADPEARAATDALEAELRLAQGQAAAAVTLAKRAMSLVPLPYLRETEAYALERAGRLAEARAVLVSLGAELALALETEGQQASRLAPLAIARLDAQLGRTADARQAIGQFMERWPTADANLPFVTKLRARIAQGTP
jgi:tetratricopeptide (TPR) repeat protein